MSLSGRILQPVVGLVQRIRKLRTDRKWATLRANGLTLGADVWLPDSTWIDPDYCFLISIGDHCGFGGDCHILAHDAQMDEFLDAGRIGRVIIHESCHIGARTVILPGVEIGPRTLVAANSVVSRTLPPNSVCAGSPAKVVCSLDDYLDKHRARLTTHPTFPYSKRALSPAERATIIEALRDRDGYIIGGRSAELSGEGGTPRTTATSRA